MESIKLYNRYNSDIRLEYISKDLWQLKSKDDDDLNYMRFIYEDDKTLHAVDPSGGPYLAVGSVVGDKYKIVEIFKNGFIFRLQEIES